MDSRSPVPESPESSSLNPPQFPAALSTCRTGYARLCNDTDTLYEEDGEEEDITNTAERHGSGLRLATTDSQAPSTSRASTGNHRQPVAPLDLRSPPPPPPDIGESFGASFSVTSPSIRASPASSPDLSGERSDPAYGDEGKRDWAHKGHDSSDYQRFLHASDTATLRPSTIRSAYDSKMNQLLGFSV